MILVEYGGNDCDFNWEEVAAAPEAEHLPKTPLSKFEGMMRGAVKAIKDKGITPLLMSLPPIDAERYIGWITKTGLSKQNIVKVARRRAHDLPLPGTLFQHHRRDRARRAASLSTCAPISWINTITSTCSARTGSIPTWTGTSSSASRSANSCAGTTACSPATAENAGAYEPAGSPPEKTK